jgi:flagellar basal-body rod modification protein FlgD
MNITSTLPANSAAQNSAPSQSGATTGSSAGTSSSDPSGISNLATQGTFITLLVAQLANQDPMNPTDATTFVTQLAQFTQVDQMVGIAQNVAAIANELGNTTSTGTTTTP